MAPDACPASLRLACERDVPAILALLLTSFRQFPLFDALYAPLRLDLDNAHDTVFFWGRRLLLGLLDPAVAIVVAEVSIGLAPTLTTEESADGDVAQSWRMLDWIVRNERLSLRSSETGQQIVGFAIWKNREFLDALRAIRSFDQHPRELEMTINLELWLYGKLYTRKDQDKAGYKSYLESEELLEQRFYAEACYYLDNLCVDFRYQRLHIGTALVRWGLKQARSEELPVNTEAGPAGVALYKKLGFEEVGIWRVHIPGGEDIEMPVMRLLAP
ncbi:hypothetical protein GP486_001850 [Trichoglossum hirsutum]|uniref:N-acetyltransferase domain-containing protein n=1 Tax=Trichoglossum hirsutum TaxID=265104 RepID=A0A9P8LFW3_9PEZI|nr:hypothetical protein GP486_001850 [Trichoglossum hirsutum]